MALTMFKEARSTATKTTWRALLIGAAVPIAMLAAAPAVSAVEIDRTATVQSEQLPGGVADPTALLDLKQCLTDLQAALPADPQAQAPAPAAGEQLLPDPAAPAPAVTDIAELTKACQAVLATVTSASPPAATAPAPAG